MEIDGLYIVRTMLESDDSYKGKWEQEAMAVTTDKEAVRESALWHFRLMHLGVWMLFKSYQGPEMQYPSFLKCLDAWVQDVSTGK